MPKKTPPSRKKSMKRRCRNMRMNRKKGSVSNGLEEPKTIIRVRKDLVEPMQNSESNKLMDPDVNGVNDEVSDESLDTLDNFDSLPTINEDISDTEEEEPELQAANRLAAAIKASRPVINIPTLPVQPPNPPSTLEKVFAQYLEFRLNSIENPNDRQEVMDNLFAFMSSEIKRVRAKTT